jgi:ribosomal-protein-alanine N-acetyltransferase
MLSPPEPPLRDDLVLLRPFEERDLDAIERALRDPEIVRWFGESTLSAHDFFAEKQKGWRGGTAASFAICDSMGTCVGQVFVEFGDDRTADVGFWLLPEGRRRGYATRAVRLIAAWVFATSSVVRLQLWTEPENTLSQAVAERSGFVREGVLRSFRTHRDGRRFDAVFYSRLPSDPA